MGVELYFKKHQLARPLTTEWNWISFGVDGQLKQCPPKILPNGNHQHFRRGFQLEVELYKSTNLHEATSKASDEGLELDESPSHRILDQSPFDHILQRLTSWRCSPLELDLFCLLALKVKKILSYYYFTAIIGNHRCSLTGWLSGGLFCLHICLFVCY